MNSTGKQRWAKTRHALFAAFALLTPLSFSASSVAESPSTSGIGDDGVGSGVMSIVSADEDYAINLASASSQYAQSASTTITSTMGGAFAFEAWVKPTSCASAENAVISIEYAFLLTYSPTSPDTSANH